jgi:hypothetical protein
MCKHCNASHPQAHVPSRRAFLKATATGIAAAGWGLLGTPAADAQATAAPPGIGEPGRRCVIRGGAVLSMDPRVGDFVQAAVLIEGKKIAGGSRGRSDRRARQDRDAGLRRHASPPVRNGTARLSGRRAAGQRRHLKLDHKVGSLTPGKEADQRRPAQPRAGRRRHADGAFQCRHRHRPRARCASGGDGYWTWTCPSCAPSWRPRATICSRRRG